MFQKLKEKLKEKQHVIVMTIITVYVAALAIKTGHVFYTEYWLKRHQEQGVVQVEQPQAPLQGQPPSSPQ
jgi:hypothetical protein